MKKVLLVFFVLAALFSSCNRTKCDCSDFLVENNSTDFEAFNKKTLIFRGYDINNQAIIYLFNDAIADTCKQYIKLVIDTKSNCVTDIRSLGDSLKCEIDTVKYENLAISFFKMNISFLEVDSLNNVFISINDRDYDIQLIKTNDSSMMKKKYSDWESIDESNWFSNPNDGNCH